MNLEGKISERLWIEIKSNYESRNFAGAILDSTHCLGEIIRQKTGLEADGVPLVGQAFGGNNPKLKVNKFQTESDVNVQSGIEQILRGVYQAFRNPRSHEKINDTQDDADSIIVFIDYLLKVIDQSKSPFSRTAFIPRIFDSDFVIGEKYSSLLIEEIPVKQRLDVYLEVLKKRETGDCEKLKWFLLALFDKLMPEEQSEALNLISEEFKVTDSNNSILTAIQVLHSKNWLGISEVAKLRIENKFISSIREGKYIAAIGKCKTGAFGTWSRRLLPYFSSKNQVLSVLTAKLFSEDKMEQDYIFQFFIACFEELVPEPSKYFLANFKEALKKGDKRFYDALDPDGPPSTYSEALKKELDEFKECPQQETAGLPESDDVPF
jgi:uncharacterized protein (TIGR02391 family)